MWLIIVSFLTCFNIGKAKDELGQEIEIDDSFNEFGVVMYVHISQPNTCQGLKVDFAVTKSLSSAVSHLDLNRFEGSSTAQLIIDLLIRDASSISRRMPLFFFLFVLSFTFFYDFTTVHCMFLPDVLLWNETR